MFIKNKQDLKRVSYICLTLLSLAAQAEGSEIKDYEDIYTNLSRLQSERKENNLKNSVIDGESEDTLSKYTLVGVALFSGKDFVSRSIQAATHSKISHVGAILSDREGQLYCFESTGSAEEVLGGEYPYVHTPAPWEDVVDNYKGEISYRLLEYEDQNKIKSKVVTNFVEKHIGKPYPKSPKKIFRAFLKTNKPPKPDGSKSFFCSELVAQLFMDADILKKGIARNVHPKYFSSKKNIDLEEGIKLTNEFKVVKKIKYKKVIKKKNIFKF